MKNIFIAFIIVLFYSCNNRIITSKNQELNKKPKAKYTTCVLVEKSFINKAGKISEQKELHLQCSIQDYFIKICAGKVTSKELKKHINKAITVDMEIKEGFWDHCSDNLSYPQSRTGTYVVINKIINK